MTPYRPILQSHGAPPELANPVGNQGFSLTLFFVAKYTWVSGVERICGDYADQAILTNKAATNRKSDEVISDELDGLVLTVANQD